MNGCEHAEVMDTGVCIACGEQVILTGQVPVSGNGGGVCDKVEWCILSPGHRGLHRAYRHPNE